MLLSPDGMKHLRWKQALIAKNGEDASYFNLLPEEMKVPIMEIYEQDKALREHREKWKEVMRAMISNCIPICVS